MTRLQALEAAGYKVVYSIAGGVIAYKGQQTYRAGTVGALYNRLIKRKEVN